MAEETTLQSMFTKYALETLFPDWEAHPENARRISRARLGEHSTDPSVPIDWEDTDVKDPVELNFEDISITTGTDPDPAVAKVTVFIEAPGTSSPLRGKTIKEIGLFVNAGTPESPDWRMVWLSDMPAMYVPTVEQSGSITISFTITVPIRFDNADQISLLTDNSSLASRIGDAESAINDLDDRTDDLAENKADQSDLTALETTVNGKAAQTDLTNLQKYVYTLNTGDAESPGTAEQKASQSAVTALTTTVGGKVDKSMMSRTLFAFGTDDWSAITLDTIHTRIPWVYCSVPGTASDEGLWLLRPETKDIIIAGNWYVLNLPPAVHLDDYLSWEVELAYGRTNSTPPTYTDTSLWLNMCGSSVVPPSPAGLTFYPNMLCGGTAWCSAGQADVSVFLGSPSLQDSPQIYVRKPDPTATGSPSWSGRFCGVLKPAAS